MKLSELKIGESAVIKTINGEGAMRHRLLEMGLTPRTKVSMINIAPLGDPLEFIVRCFNLSLRKEECDLIEVEICK